MWDDGEGGEDGEDDVMSWVDVVALTATWRRDDDYLVNLLFRFLSLHVTAATLTRSSFRPDLPEFSSHLQLTRSTFSIEQASKQHIRYPTQADGNSRRAKTWSIGWL